MITARISHGPIGRPGKIEGATGVARDGHWELPIVIVGETAESDAGLVQLLDARQPFGSRFSLADGGQQNGSEDGNDGDDSKQFQNGERTRVPAGRNGFHHLIPYTTYQLYEAYC